MAKTRRKTWQTPLSKATRKARARHRVIIRLAKADRLSRMTPAEKAEDAVLQQNLMGDDDFCVKRLVERRLFQEKEMARLAQELVEMGERRDRNAVMICQLRQIAHRTVVGIRVSRGGKTRKPFPTETPCGCCTSMMRLTKEKVVGKPFPCVFDKVSHHKEPGCFVFVCPKCGWRYLVPESA